MHKALGLTKDAGSDSLGMAPLGAPLETAVDTSGASIWILGKLEMAVKMELNLLRTAQTERMSLFKEIFSIIYFSE